MQLPSLLPNIGTPVPTDLLNVDKLADASLGELVHAGTQLLRVIVEKMHDPTTYDTIPTFSTEPGDDWNGFRPRAKPATTTEHASTNVPAAPSEQTRGTTEPVAPDNYYDTLQALGLMFGRLEHLTEAANTLYASYVTASMHQQQRYFGTPYEASAFRDARQYLRHTRNWSAAKTKKHLQRGPLVTHRPGGDPAVLSSHPTYPAVAQSFTSGRLSPENLDRILAMHTELHDYAGACDVPPGLVDQVMAAFEPVLAEAGEHVTPEELSAAKKGWMDQIAHELNADGPSPSQALRKPPDNAINTKSFPEGGGRIWLNATPEIYTQFKNFMLHMLKTDGSPPDIPDDLRNLIHPTRSTQDDEQTTGADSTGHSAKGADSTRQHADEASEESDGPGPSASDAGSPQDEALFEGVPDNLDDLRRNDTGQAVGEDASGNTYTTSNLQDIDPMSSGQQIAALLIGMFRTILRMPPHELGIKKSHGASAQLVIVQDVQTAYHTLGVPPLPPDLQRPAGPTGLTPPTIRHPNPDSPDQTVPQEVDEPGRDDPGEPAMPGRYRFINRHPWTPYRSEALNHGSIHPADAELLSCDSELVAHLWDGPDTVLQQKRTKRLFTTAQRRAILTRDQGCQAPGCTTPAVYCDIHHIKDWLAGGNTSVTNAITLCNHHHAAVHIGKWHIRKHHGHTWFQPAIWLDPYQPLLRNLHWNR